MADFIYLILFVIYAFAAINVVQFFLGFLLTTFKRTNRLGLFHLGNSIIGISLVHRRCKCKNCDGSCRIWECKKFPDNQ